MVAKKDERLAFSTGDPCLRAREASEYLGLKSFTSFYGLVNSGKLPEGAFVSDRAKVWRRSALDKYLESVGAESVIGEEK